MAAKVYEKIGTYEHQSYTGATGHLYLFEKRQGYNFVVAKVYDEKDQKFFENKKGEFAEVSALSKIYSAVSEVIAPKPKEYKLIAYKIPAGKKADTLTFNTPSRKNYLFLKTDEFAYPVVKVYAEDKIDSDYFLSNPDFIDATKDILKQREDEKSKYDKYIKLDMKALRKIGEKYGVNDSDKDKLAKEIIAKERGN